MPTNFYDLIVIGDDFAGLVAGTLCAKRGLRVLLLSRGQPAGYHLGPYHLPVEPLPVCGLSSPPIRRVLDELNLGHVIKRKLRETDTPFQFVTPDLRVDVSEDEHVLASELARELGESERAVAEITRATELAQVFDEVLAGQSEFPPSGFFQKRELGRMASKRHEEAQAWFDGLASHDVLRALVSVPALLSTHTDHESMTASACARSLHLWQHGASRIRGDWETLREIFLDKLGQGNGETRIGRVAELTWSWGKVNGVRLENGEELGASHVIAAIPVAELAELAGRKVPKRLSQCVDTTELAGYRYTLNLVVDEAGIPEGMGSQVFVVHQPEKPLLAENAVAIYVAEPDDEARVVVSVSAVCPPPGAGQELDDVLADLRVRLRERIELVMPFFSEHVLLAHAPNESAPAEGVRADPGKGFPVPPTPVWRSTLDSALGVSAVPYSVGIKHLTIASSQVLPRLGVEGDFVTGWCAAKLACDAMGRKRDYLKDEVIASG